MKKRKTERRVHLEIEEGALPAEAYTHRLPAGQRHRTPGGVEIEIAPEAVEILGLPGRLISASKTRYHEKHPDHHEVYFNGCLFDEAGVERWFGDIDLTLEREKLERLAGRIGTIYLTPESAYRWEGLVDHENDERVLCFLGASKKEAGPSEGRE